MAVPPPARPEFKGEPMKPNEIYHAVQPCEEHMLAPARVQLEVEIDEQGEPQQALVSSLGGTMRHAFANCARTRLLAQEYAPRGKPMVIGAIVDLRVGAYSNAGNPTPVPPGY
jgi:hypothetical protein